MKSRSRQYQEKLKKIDRNRFYDPYEAAVLVKELANAKFDETFEVVFRLGVDPRRADQMVRGSVMLPKGTGKEVRVLAFASGEKEEEAREAGADWVGGKELADKIQEGWLDFDVAIATPDMMSIVGKLGKILGPRGLMPNPKSGTVTFDIGRAVREAKAGKIEYRVDKQGNVHLVLGKVSFPVEDILANYQTVLDEIIKARPAAVKGRYIKSITFSSTMGPPIKVDPMITKVKLPEGVSAGA